MEEGRIGKKKEREEEEEASTGVAKINLKRMVKVMKKVDSEWRKQPLHLHPSGEEQGIMGLIYSHLDSCFILFHIEEIEMIKDHTHTDQHLLEKQQGIILFFSYFIMG